MIAKAFGQAGAQGGGEPMARAHHQIAQLFSHGGGGAIKAGGLRGADGKGGHRPLGPRHGQPAADPARGVAGGDGVAEQAALDPGFGVEMAAGGFGQTRGVDQAEVARVVKVGQG